jgi:PAS domain S-box-containing protein
LEELERLGKTLARALDLDWVLQELLVVSAQAVGGTRGAAYLLEPAGRLSLRARFGYRKTDEVGLSDFYGQGEWLRSVVEASEPVGLLRSGGKSSEFGPRLLRKAGARSLLVVPLVLGKDRLGALVVFSAKEDLTRRLALLTPAIQAQLGHATALVRAVSLAVDSERRFHNLVQRLDAIVWEADPASFQFTFVSRHAERLLGYSPEQWLGTDFWVRHIHPDDRRRALVHCRKAVTEGEDQELEYRMTAADGRTVWFRDLIHVEQDESGRTARLSGLLIDVTERKQAESKLRERTVFLTTLIENSPFAIVVLDAEHCVQMCNPAFEKLFGYRRDEIVGTHLDELIAPPAKMREATRFTQRTLARDQVHATTRRRRKDGTEVDVEVYGVPLLIEGKLTGIYAIYRDITERQEAERSLRESEERYRLLFQANPHPMWVYDLSTLAFLAVNDAAVQHYGYSREEFQSMTIKEIRPLEEVGRLLENVARVRDGIDLGGVWKHRKKDGTLIDVDIVSHTITFAGRRAELVLATDVTQRRILERQLQQATKMEAVGRLAGGIAHDFNNLLMVVRGHTELMRNRLEASSPLTHGVNEIEKAADRAASLTQQLLAFSRKQMVQPRVLDLNAIVTDMEDMLERLIGEQVELAIASSPELGRLRADQSQVEQILLNLVVNARDAMPDGGTLAVKTDNIRLDHDYTSRHPGSREGPYVMLAVRDTGMGMDAETQAQIFEPFFTTKELGKGTGMGLSTVYGIVKQSNGYIEVDSEIGTGTTFRVYFPRVQEERADEPETDQVAAPLAGPETVLLVEDEAPLRAMVGEFLEGRGYQVLKAADAGEALRVAGRHGSEIDLVITDLVMPGLSGRELAGRLAHLHPEAKVLYMSGYAEDAGEPQGSLPPDAPFLQKPFALQALAQKVCEVLPPGQTGKRRP